MRAVVYAVAAIVGGALLGLLLALELLAAVR